MIIPYFFSILKNANRGYKLGEKKSLILVATQFFGKTYACLFWFIVTW